MEWRSNRLHFGVVMGLRMKWGIFWLRLILVMNATGVDEGVIT
jgi:hypothetical protein